MIEIFIIKRDHRYDTMYLMGWDNKFGTICIGNIQCAMTFGTAAAAAEAADRANATCCGYRGAPKPVDMIFSVVSIPEPYPHYIPDNEAFILTP